MELVRGLGDDDSAVAVVDTTPRALLVPGEFFLRKFQTCKHKFGIEGPENLLYTLP